MIFNMLPKLLKTLYSMETLNSGCSSPLTYRTWDFFPESVLVQVREAEVYLRILKAPDRLGSVSRDQKGRDSAS